MAGPGPGPGSGSGSGPGSGSDPAGAAIIDRPGADGRRRVRAPGAAVLVTGGKAAAPAPGLPPVEPAAPH